MSEPNKTKIYFLDNLRTTMIFLVVLYHSAIVYQSGFEDEWIVSDPMKSKSIGLIGLYLNTFVMFIIFFISGYLSPLSLKKKSIESYIKSKIKRIGIPWLLAVIVLIPAYKFIFLYSRNLPQEHWTSYFHIHTRINADAGMWSDAPTQSWLWFLPILLLFHYIYAFIPKNFFTSMKKPLTTAIIILFAVGLIYSMLISMAGNTGWFYSILLDFQIERLLIYFMVFLLGSLVFRLKTLENYKRNTKLFIWVNVVMTLSITAFTAFAMNLFFNIVYPERNFFILSKIWDIAFYYSFLLISMLCFIYIFIDLFKLKFDKKISLFEKLGRQSYTVYIVHMVVIGIISLLLQDASWPVFIKFPLLFLSAYLISNIIASSIGRLRFKRKHKLLNNSTSN